ncbi:MAG: hypothetical protein CMJ89_15795 [Planctomycetes bacterium]|nr:hypothetical protein [Planctomycetota bacterium]
MFGLRTARSGAQASMADRERTEWTPDIKCLQARMDAEWVRVEQSFCGRLLAYAQRRTGDLQASEDIVQETLLGAVRGIDSFDSKFSFEQYLFGIARNRTIDYLRRRKARTLAVAEEDHGSTGLETLATQSETPSAIVRGRELSDRARVLLAEILRDWVEETWRQSEFGRLCVIEAIFSGGWRNRDTWKRFGLRDETAVAGIKFRALRRLRQLASVRESGSDLLHFLAVAEETDHRILDLDVRRVWKDRRVSCPDRHWIARFLMDALPEGSAAFVRFHIEEMKCSICIANRDDVENADRAELEPLMKRVRVSTRQALQGLD